MIFTELDLGGLVTWMDLGDLAKAQLLL